MNKRKLAAAVVLMVEPEVSSNLIKGLEDRDLITLCEGVRELKTADFENGGLEGLLKAFHNDLKTLDPLPAEGVERLQELMTSVLGDSRANRILKEFPGHANDGPFHFLEDVPPAHAAEILSGEHPQASAQVLSNLEPAVTARILTHLDEESQVQIGRSMALARPVRPEWLGRLATMIKKKGEATEKIGGARERAAERNGRILKLLLPSVAQRIIDRVKEEEPGLGAAIRENMYTILDLATLPPKAVQTLLAGIDTRTLALAIKQIDPDVKDNLLRNISKRAREAILEESEFLEDVPASQIRKAHEDLLSALWGAIESGAIQIQSFEEAMDDET